MPGRGESDWLADPNDYVFPTYLTTLVALIARSGAESVDWVGTSMGGLLGIVAAAQPKSPVARLVVNDVGPVIEPAALERIRGYFGADPDFATYDEIERYIRTVSAPFGPLTDAQWEHVTRTNVRQRPDGRWRLAYDPGIAVPFRASAAPTDLWGVWDAIRCPTLVLRGAQSDLLSAATAAQMAARGPKPAHRRIRRTSAMRPCCCRPSRSSRSRASCAPTAPTSARRRDASATPVESLASGRAQSAVIAYNRGRPWP